MIASDTKRAAYARAAIVLLSFGFRLPEIVHAREVNSDAAIVGLQAMHLARGELSAFLWGSGYQSAADAYWAVPFFAVLGPTPVALVLSALTLHTLATLAVFSFAERHAKLARLPNPPFAAALLSLPLVFTTAAIHTYALYPPRQLSITCAMLGLVLADRAVSGKRPWLAFAGAGFLASFACAADPYALVFAPLVALSVLGASIDTEDGSRLPLSRASATVAAKRLGIGALGAALGLVPLLLLWRSSGAKLGVTNTDSSRFAHNLELFTRECGPWAFGSKSYYARHMMDYAPWEPPASYTLFAKGAVCIFLAFFPAAALLSFFAKHLSYATRRAGIVGFAALPLTLYGFMTSVMVMDHFSMRYLASIPLLVPFALTPLLATLGPRKLAALLAPTLIAAGVSGWVSFGPDVDGPFVARRTPGPTDEERVTAFLGERGVKSAMADYWTSYRVSFVTAEKLEVVPTHAAQDRYAPYRRELEAAGKVAYLIDPLRTGESPDAVAEALAKGELVGKGRVERASVGRFTVFVIDRTP